MQFLMKLLLLSIVSILANASEPYCTRNETIIKRIPVTKTGVVVKKPTGAFKWFKKTKYQTETYEDFEEQRHVKVVHGCCDGYKMSEQRLCEPICEQSCPKKSICVEPNVCECAVGYVTAINSSDGSHYCEPICESSCPINAKCVEPDLCACEHGYHKLQDASVCEPRCSSGCPYGGQCVAPEQCLCAAGYSFEAGTCVPQCIQGDGCQYGRCVGPEHCVCNKGYQMNEESRLCMECVDADCLNAEDTETASTENYFDFAAVDSADDENKRIFVSAPATASNERNTPISCPPNFFYYNNVCRPKHFASNEFDCRFKPCVENAFCQANGTCACKEGYIWYKHNNFEATEIENSSSEDSGEDATTTESDTTTEILTTTEVSTTENPIKNQIVCLTPAEIQILLRNVQKSIIDDGDDSMDWMSIGVIILGILCMVGALSFLVFRLLRHRKQKLDVEAKNDLSCSYQNKNYSSSPYVY